MTQPQPPTQALPAAPQPKPAASAGKEIGGPRADHTAPSSPSATGIAARPTNHGAGDDQPDGARQDDAEPPAARIHELRTVLSASTNRRNQFARTVTPHCGQRSRGLTWSAIQVQAFCQCGWATTWQPWASTQAGAADAKHIIDAALDGHSRQSGHQPFRHDSIPEVDGYHQRCGWFHGFQAACPIPHDSPAGQLTRIAGVATFGDSARCRDRLNATQQLRAWLDDQQLQAIIGARLSGCTWSDIAQAVGIRTEDAYARWGSLIGRYEAVGLLTPDATPKASQQDPPQRSE